MTAAIEVLRHCDVVEAVVDDKQSDDNPTTVESHSVESKLDPTVVTAWLSDEAEQQQGDWPRVGGAGRDSSRFVTIVVIASSTILLIIITLHCYAAAQCIVIGPVCGFVAVWVCYITITRNYVHRSSPNWVCRWR